MADLPAEIAAHPPGARLRGPLLRLFRTRHLPQTLRFASLWSLAVGLFNLPAALFDTLTLPPLARPPVLLLRLLLALAYLTAAAGLGNPRARRFSALIIILLSLLTLAASFLMGAQAGGALFYVIYQGMGLAMVCTAIVFGQTERAALVWLIALSTALLAVCVAVSPLPGMAAKAQFAVYYGLFMAGLGLAKTLQDRTAERLFLLQLRDELAADEMAARNDQLASMACTDPLTGLANRRAFDEVMAALETDSSWALPLALCMLDLDHFKPFNDRLGHLAGDDCLRQAAGAMRAQLRRQTDVLARYGGEEFVLILPNTSHAEAQDIAARVRAAVFALGRSHPASPFGRVTVSAGLAVAGSAERVRGLVAQADGALYRAKQAGRNQVAL
ncbi:GGDEF domain-containing protein [Acidocella sp.]|uniref:GGDEF domain-containing protein n=2 Tax=Acidocella sp. TaxID=50710 RepID=UPI002622A342|nr:GGDEF domain-containing protein [Acidocella sp.]